MLNTGGKDDKIMSKRQKQLQLILKEQDKSETMTKMFKRLS